MILNKIQDGYYSLDNGDKNFGTVFYDKSTDRWRYLVAEDTINLSSDELFSIYIVLDDLNKDLSYEIEKDDETST